jgi:uncharacterized damage-inducible protein DinB
MKTLLKTIYDSLQYTLSVAEVMPEKNYDTVLAKSTWSFIELMNHIAYGIKWWEVNFVQGIDLAWEPPTDKTTKKEVIALLAQAFDSLEKAVSKESDSEELVRGVWATLDHVTHHRGQAVVHLRKAGVVPPDYVGISKS